MITHSQLLTLASETTLSFLKGWGLAAPKDQTNQVPLPPNEIPLHGPLLKVRAPGAARLGKMLPLSPASKVSRPVLLRWWNGREHQH